MVVASGNHRIDLAGHDAAARLQRRQRDLAQARQRPAVHPAQVVGDLHQAHGNDLELAGQFHRGILGRHRLEEIAARLELDPVRRRSSLQKAAPKPDAH
jgi:hypothetical protein